MKVPKSKRQITSSFNKIIVLALVVVAGLWLLRSLLVKGFPATHDGENHLARLANLHLAAIDRNFPFRWARNLNYQFGYPVFNFNYYLPEALALFPLKAGLSIEESLKMVIILSFLAGGIGAFLFLNEYFGILASTTGALLYLAYPYQMVDIFVRGNVGEILAVGILPTLFCLFIKLRHSPSRLWFAATVLFLVAFLLSHNITVMFGLPFLLSFILVESWQEHQKIKWWFLVSLIFILGIGIVQFFWLPLLKEKQFTNIDLIASTHDYANHFPFLSQLIHSPWGYGFSKEGRNDGFTFEVGPFHWVGIILAIFFVLKQLLRKSKKRVNLSLVFFLLSFIFFFFLMNKISLPLWQIVSVWRYAQFPWRLLGLTILPISFLIAFLTQRVSWLGIILTLGALIYMGFIAKPQGTFQKGNMFYYHFPFDTNVLGENMPRWFNLEKNHELKGKIFGLPQSATFKEITWKTQKHLYEIETGEAVTIAERTAYFPGWKVKVDGQLVKIEPEEKDYPGMISFMIPTGKHLIETTFTENTPARNLGDKISLISLGIFVFLLVTGWWPYAKKNKK